MFSRACPMYFGRWTWSSTSEFQTHEKKKHRKNTKITLVFHKCLLILRSVYCLANPNKWRFAIFLARFLVIVSVMLVSNTSLKRITCLVSQWSQWEVVWEKRGKGFFVFKWVKWLDLQKSSTWPSIMNRQPSHESDQHGSFLSKSGPWPAVRCSHALLPTWQSGREGKFLASDPGSKFRNIRKFVPAKIRDTACQLDYVCVSSVCEPVNMKMRREWEISGQHLFHIHFHFFHCIEILCSEHSSQQVPQILPRCQKPRSPTTFPWTYRFQHDIGTAQHDPRSAALFPPSDKY